MNEDTTGCSVTHRLARVFVRPLVGGPVTANHLTTLRLLTGVAACIAFACGGRGGEIWGGALWVLSAFLDRADGELARLAGSSSACKNQIRTATPSTIRRTPSNRGNDLDR